MAKYDLYKRVIEYVSKKNGLTKKLVVGATLGTLLIGVAGCGCPRRYVFPERNSNVTYKRDHARVGGEGNGDNGHDNNGGDNNGNSDGGGGAGNSGPGSK